MAMPPLDNGAGDDELARAQALLANAKKLALFVAGVAYQKFGEKLTDEQEVLAGVSDIISDLYLAESAVLRTLKARKGGRGSSVMTDLSLSFVNSAVERMEQQARVCLAAVSQGDELRAQLAIVRRLLRWSPLNGVAMGRRIVKRLCEVGSYPALVAGGQP